MKRIAFGLVLVLAASVVSARTGARDAKSELQAKYDELAKAFSDNNPKPFENDLAPDYTLHVPGRPVENRAHIIADFKHQMSNMKKSSWRRKVTALVDHHSSVTVTVVSHFEGQFGPKNSSFENDATSSDTWVKTAKGWQLQKSVLVKMSAKIDGKSVGGI